MTCDSSFKSLKPIFNSFSLAKSWVIQTTSLLLVLIETDTYSYHNDVTNDPKLLSFSWALFRISSLEQSFVKTAFDKLINWLEIQASQCVAASELRVISKLVNSSLKSLIATIKQSDFANLWLQSLIRHSNPQAVDSIIWLIKVKHYIECFMFYGYCIILVLY